jgi:hypothetical protein
MKLRLRKTSPAVWFAAGVIAAVATTGTAMAATGGNFLLGRSNTATTLTTLSNSTGTPLRLLGPVTKAPLNIGANKTKVANLNADLLDGLDATALQRKLVTPSCAAGKVISAISAAGVVTCVSLPHVPTSYFAVVNANATLARGSAGTTVAGTPGNYRVGFPTNVTGCAFVAGTGLTTFSNTQPDSTATTVGAAGDPNGVFVATYNTAGAVAAAPFHLVVMCP